MNASPPEAGVPATDRPARSLTWLLASIFAVMVIITTLQGYLARRAVGEPTTLSSAVIGSILTWVCWLIAAPAIIWLGRRVPFTRGRLLSAFVVHLVFLMVIYVGWTLAVISVSIRLFAPDEALTSQMVIQSLLGSARLSLALLTYASILGVDHLVRAQHDLRAREVQAIRLESLATRGRLDALASRLQPHFLFNALQSISALIDTHPARARTMLAQLGDLLRDTLDTTELGEVPLSAEAALLGRYLAIEETRFADRLSVEVSIDPDAAAVMVPRFLLQPLAENALRHGLAPLPEGGTLRVTATRAGDVLRVVVWNDGTPLPSQLSEGVGLATTRERLNTRFGDRASLHLRQALDGGTEAVVELPT